MGVAYRSAVTHTSGALGIGDAPPLLFARLGRFGPRVRAPIAKWYLGAQQVDQPARDQPRGRAGPAGRSPRDRGCFSATSCAQAAWRWPLPCDEKVRVRRLPSVRPRFWPEQRAAMA